MKTRLLLLGTAVLLMLNLVGCAEPDGYVVSGTITDEDGNPIPGVVLNFSGETDFGTATTDAGGTWRKPGLDGEVTITPSRTGFSFEPQSSLVTSEAESVNFACIIDLDAFLVYDDFSGNELNPSLWVVYSGEPQVANGQLSTLAPPMSRIWTEKALSGDFTVDIEVADYQSVMSGGTLMRNRMTFYLSSDREELGVGIEFVRLEDRVEIRYGSERDGAGVSSMRTPFTVTLKKHGAQVSFVVDGEQIGPFNHPFGDSRVFFGLQTWSDAAGPVGSVYDRITIY